MTTSDLDQGNAQVRQVSPVPEEELLSRFIFSAVTLSTTLPLPMFLSNLPQFSRLRQILKQFQWIISKWAYIKSLSHSPGAFTEANDTRLSQRQALANLEGGAGELSLAPQLSKTVCLSPWDTASLQALFCGTSFISFFCFAPKCS